MNKMLKTLAICLVLVGMQVQAQTSLYEVTKGKQKILLGGTIHVLRNSDYPLPAEYEHAYEQAQVLVLETDLKKANSPEFGQQFAAVFMYSGGKNLAQDLKPNVWQSLQSYADQEQFPLGQMSMFKAVFVSISMTVAAMQKNGYGLGQGVDMYFQQKATLANKPVRELESTEDVLLHMQALKDMDANQVIESTLRDLHSMDKVMQKSLTYWRKGELDKLDQEMAKPMRTQTPQMYDELLVKRNQAWLPKIEKMFATPEIELVLVGALHLGGEDGLLNALQSRGYQVKTYRVPAE